MRLNAKIKAIEAGEEIFQETRRWNPEQRYTTPMRSKEMAHDYRYFPDPDLMPVKIDKSWIDQVKKELPEKPFDKQRRYIEEMGLPYSITSALCPTFHSVNFLNKPQNFQMIQKK